jgi:hypothetical protein
LPRRRFSSSGQGPVGLPPDLHPEHWLFCCGVLLSDEKTIFYLRIENSYLDDAKIVLVNDLVMNYA